MCGRVVVAMDSATLARIGRARNMRNAMRYKQSYNIAPTGYIPCVYHSNTSDQKEEESLSQKEQIDENELEAMKWGTKNKEEILIINARSDTVPVYQFYKSLKRCAVIISGYYEWKKEGEKVAQPYYIKSKEADHLILAGLYKETLDEDGFDIKECVIITQNAQKNVELIHDRMPVIINDKIMTDYLNGSMSFEELFKTVNDASSLDMEAYPVGDLVNKLNNNGKDNILHKDEVKYDKNKNLKLTNFFHKITEKGSIITYSDVKKAISTDIEEKENKTEKKGLSLATILTNVGKISPKKQHGDESVLDDTSTVASRKIDALYFKGKRKSCENMNEKEIFKKSKKRPTNSNSYNRDILTKFLNNSTKK